MEKIQFFQEYFLDSENVLHYVGECINEKAFVLPQRISSDFKLTKCGKETKGMEYNSIFNNNVSFCKTCTNK